MRRNTHVQLNKVVSPIITLSDFGQTQTCAIMNMKNENITIFLIHIIFIILATCLIIGIASEDTGDGTKAEDELVDDEKLTYAKGSICGYCEYCKFCKLCDEDCPCETTAKKPNCKMCKYCKYCYVCSSVCDTICKPGGIIDKVSAAIVNALPTYDREEVDKDIDDMKDWITLKKDEL